MMALTNSGGRLNNAKMPISRAEAKGRSCCLRSSIAVEVSPDVCSGIVPRVLLLRTEAIAFFNDVKFIVRVSLKDESVLWTWEESPSSTLRIS